MVPPKHPAYMKYESKETFDVEYSEIAGEQSYSCTSKKYAICRVDEECQDIPRYNDASFVVEESDDNDADTKSNVTRFFDDEEEPWSQSKTQTEEGRIEPAETDFITTTPQHSDNEYNEDDEDDEDDTSNNEYHAKSKQSTNSPKPNPKPKHKPSSSPNHGRTETSQSCWKVIQTPTGRILKIGATCTIIEARIQGKTRAELIETR